MMVNWFCSLSVGHREISISLTIEKDVPAPETGGDFSRLPPASVAVVQAAMRHHQSATRPRNFIKGG